MRSVEDKGEGDGAEYFETGRLLIFIFLKGGPFAIL